MEHDTIGDDVKYHLEHRPKKAIERDAECKFDAPQNTKDDAKPTAAGNLVYELRGKPGLFLPAMPPTNRARILQEASLNSDGKAHAKHWQK